MKPLDLRPQPFLAGLLLLGGCHLDTPEDPAFRPTAYTGPVAEMPTARPTPVATPGPPPQAVEEQAPACGDGQIAVPGQWTFTSRWSWQPGYCVLDRVGYAYIPPTYERGLYIAGYFAVQHEVNRVGPTYRRFVHPEGLELAPPRPEAPAPQPQAPAAQPKVQTVWVGGGGAYPLPYPWPRTPVAPRQRPAPTLRVGEKYDPGQGERPRRPPPGWGERP